MGSVFCPFLIYCWLFVVSWLCICCWDKPSVTIHVSMFEISVWHSCLNSIIYCLQFCLLIIAQGLVPVFSHVSSFLFKLNLMIHKQSSLVHDFAIVDCLSLTKDYTFLFSQWHCWWFWLIIFDYFLYIDLSCFLKIIFQRLWVQFAIPYRIRCLWVFFHFVYHPSLMVYHVCSSLIMYYVLFGLFGVIVFYLAISSIYCWPFFIKTRDYSRFLVYGLSSIRYCKICISPQKRAVWTPSCFACFAFV